MKSIYTFVILIAFGFIGKTASADTLSYWHIDYNQVTILESHQGMEGYEIEMDSDTIYGESLFTFKYSNGCLICVDCKTHLAVYDQNQQLIQHEDARGDWIPITISFQRIIEHHIRTGEDTYDFYFYQEGWSYPESALHVLRLKFN